MKETVIFELHLTGEGESKAAPDMVQLLPAGRITARDGRVFVLNDPEAVVERSKLSGGIDLPIDYEHQNDNPESRKNGPVPAAGWIKELIARPDGIWGRVEWTDRARQLITAREYRYLSPALLLARGSDVVMRIKGAGLVHNPALELTALAREEEDAAPALARIAEALGLDADAGEVAILAAIHDTATPDSTRSIPTDKVAELMADLRETKTQLRELQTNIRVDAAIAGGQVTPGMRDWATALCMADPDAFEVFATESEKKNAHLFRIYDFPEHTRPGASPDTPEAKLARQLGIDPARLRD